MAGLEALDERLATLERHLKRPGRALVMLDAQGSACCDAAGAVVAGQMDGCGCCSGAASS